MNHIRLSILGVALASAAACGRETHVAVVASLEPGVPLEGLEVVALPYDPQRLLDSLAALAPTPRPDFSSLEAELMAFRRPEYDEDDAAVRDWAAVRDSVRRLSDSLQGVDRASPGYPGAYDRFRRMYERFLQKTAARDAGVRGLTGELRDLAIRAGQAADSLRAWEQAAWAGADSAATLAQAALGRSTISGTVDSTGTLILSLPPGDWWLQALVPHAENPFTEYAWTVPFRTAGIPFRLPLSRVNTRVRWRH